MLEYTVYLHGSLQTEKESGRVGQDCSSRGPDTPGAQAFAARQAEECLVPCNSSPLWGEVTEKLTVVRDSLSRRKLRIQTFHINPEHS